jgi:hypothetical protein
MAPKKVVKKQPATEKSQVKAKPINPKATLSLKKSQKEEASASDEDTDMEDNEADEADVEESDFDEDEDDEFDDDEMETEERKRIQLILIFVN